jgi:5-bromo-4-chloroindolyl phosphate hydrolysis protein
MQSISLSLIVSSAKDRANGYIEEVLNRGKINGSCVTLSDDDYNYIKNNFSLSSDKKQSARVAFIDPSANIKVSRLF